MIIWGVEEEKIWENKKYENNMFKYTDGIDGGKDYGIKIMKG